MINFVSKIGDEELLEGVTYIKKSDYGLSYDIIIDSGKTYKYFQHLLCLYIVDQNKVYPVGKLRIWS